MGLLRDYLWLWVVLVVLLLSFIIVIFFLYLNKWIRKQGRQILHLDKRSNFKAQSHRYEATNFQSVFKVSTPALPPRTQFLTEESQSYENLKDEPDYEDPDVKVDYENGQDNYTNSTKQLDYVEVESEAEPLSYEQPEDTASLNYEQPEDTASLNYEQPEDTASLNYEQPEDTASVDYEEPEDTASVDYEEPEDTASVDYEQPEDTVSVDYLKLEDTPSAEDYDDIRADDQEEDYDDLG